MNNTISDFARRTGFDGFAQDVFGGMKGNPFVKQALTAALFSRPEAPLHLLIVGNPGTGKTTIKHIAKKTFNGLTLSAGANSTKAGLLFNARSGTPGILLSGNGKIVLLDEMDKIAEDDIEYCYEIMSEGKCTIAAGDIQEEVESRPIIIAFCNPAYGSFVYSPLDELQLSPTLLSRFSFVIKTDELSQEELKNLAIEKFFQQLGEQNDDISQYSRWVQEARDYSPEFLVSEAEAEAYVKECFDALHSAEYSYTTKKLRRDQRMAEYIRRIPEAIARAEFSPVTKGTLEKAKHLIFGCLKTWKPITEEPIPLLLRQSYKRGYA